MRQYEKNASILQGNYGDEYYKMSKSINPYDDGFAINKIADVIENV